MKSLRQSILAKILGTVIGIVVLGFGVFLYVVIDQEKNSSIEEKKRASDLMAQPIIQSIYKDMLAERADLVRYIVRDMKALKNVERVQIIRSNGTEEAFQDLKTIRAVEKEYGDPEPEWLADHPNQEHNVALGVDNPRFQEAVKLFNEGRKNAISYFEEHDVKRLLTYLVPIEAKPKCRSCHATYEEARGVLMISASLEDMYAMLKSNRNRWMIFGFFTILGVFLLVSFMVKSIVDPIQRISSAARDIASGRYNISIPVKTSDEIGALSESFNKMAHEIGAKTDEMMRLSQAIEQSINIVFMTDIKGNIEYVNPMFESVTGWSKHEAIGRNPRILASGLTIKTQYKELWDTVLAGKTFRYTFQNKKKNGQLYWANALISPIKNRTGETTHFLAIQEDITEKKESEERAQYLESYDALTGLLNRARFMELMDEWITYAKTCNQTGALLLINIDDFKYINEAYGHSTGDEFLRRIAGMLKDAIHDLDVEYMKKARKESIVAHLGGDEFAVFLSSLGEKEVLGAVQLILTKLERLYIHQVSAHLTATVGMVSYPEHGVTVKELFTKADAAMFHAKETGKNKCHIFHAEDYDLIKMHSRLEWKERIREAVENGRFVPWFQPILDLKDDKIHHYEALARMRQEDGAILLPSAFIETAEIFNLIGSIDRIVTEKAMRFQEKMARNGRHVSVSMNLSGRNLGDEELLLFLNSKIKEIGLDPGYLTFEITETAAVRDMDKAMRFIKSLKSAGCHFSLDDFGVGFTSFVYLREMGVDYIKIDGSFIKNLHQSRNDQLFVKAIADVAQGMGIKTIAEFVENKETIKLLKEYGIDYAQGYAIGRPAPREEIERSNQL